MEVAVLKETYPGEQRVALIPASIPKLEKTGFRILVETGAGESAGFADQLYLDAGAQVVERSELASANVFLQVRSLGANPIEGRSDLDLLSEGKIVIGMCDPLGQPESVAEMASHGITQFALEMVPRISRAQSMDVLSSMATIAGYRAVLLSAVELPQMFPMNMTAAGTLTPAQVFVIGAGVAGLQAIATARRLGAVVRAYDVRPAVKEQVESLGAKFVELDLDTGEAEDAGGYAKEMGDDFISLQQQKMAEVVAGSDVVISTAAIPGRDAPLLITTEAVRGMKPGSVIVDLAAERGGNSEPSRPDERVIESGVVVLGPTNLPSEIPNHASQMYSNNVARLLLEMVDEDQHLFLDLDDEIINGTLVAHEGVVVNHRVIDLLDATCEEVVGVADTDLQDAVSLDDSPIAVESSDDAADHASDSVEVEDGFSHDMLLDDDVDAAVVDDSVREDQSNGNATEESNDEMELEENLSPYDLGSVEDEYDIAGEEDLVADDVSADADENREVELMSDGQDDSVQESLEDDQNQDELSLE